VSRILPLLLFAASLLDLGALTLVAAELVRSLRADLSSSQAGGVSPPRRPWGEGGRALTLLLDHAASLVVVVALLAGAVSLALGAHQPTTLDRVQAVVAIQPDGGGGGADPSVTQIPGASIGVNNSKLADAFSYPVDYGNSNLDQVVTSPPNSTDVPDLSVVSKKLTDNSQGGNANRLIVHNPCGGAGGGDDIATAFGGGDPGNPPISSGCNVNTSLLQDVPTFTPGGLLDVKVPRILQSSTGGSGGGGSGGGGSKGKDDPNALPDNSLVVRGGTNTPDRFANASGSWTDEQGRVWDVSVNGSPDKTFEELTQGMPHKQVGMTTAGDIRGKGGVISPDPLEGNPDHCLTGGCTPDEFSSLFTPTKKNPNVK